MRKPDDDLKIDIADLFGDDLSGPSEKLEESAALMESAEKSAAQTPSSSETENNFQQWMNSRNIELEAKSQELEKKFQGTQASEKTSSEKFSAQELLTVQPEAETRVPTASSSPIDFNAPIPPPFMGLAPAPAPPAESGTQAATGVPASSPNPEELKKLQAEYEFLMLYDEFRNIIFFELKDLVGEKKTYTMLGRTVELAREKYPEIFRNANWDSTGNLLEDGSVDSQRLIENKNALNSQKAEEILDAALSGLLKLRLQAVEKGLGVGLKNKVRAHLYQWISEKTQKAIQEGKNATNLKKLSGYVAST
jgi:hypothetical protein